MILESILTDEIDSFSIPALAKTSVSWEGTNIMPRKPGSEVASTSTGVEWGGVGWGTWLLPKVEKTLHPAAGRVSKGLEGGIGGNQ